MMADAGCLQFDGSRMSVAALRVLSGDAALSGLSEPAFVSVHGASTRRGVPPNNDARVQLVMFCSVCAHALVVRLLASAAAKMDDISTTTHYYQMG